MAFEDHVLILISSDILVLMVILWLPGRVPCVKDIPTGVLKNNGP